MPPNVVPENLNAVPTFIQDVSETVITFVEVVVFVAVSV